MVWSGIILLQAGLGLSSGSSRKAKRVAATHLLHVAAPPIVSPAAEFSGLEVRGMDDEGEQQPCPSTELWSHVALGRGTRWEASCGWGWRVFLAASYNIDEIILIR